MSKTHTSYISILVPAYNAEKTIERCLESIFVQSFTKYEIIIANDCSTDTTREKIENLGRQHRITLINHSENLGLPAARNTAIKAARGTYVLHLDADDFFLCRDLLARLFQTAENDQCDILKFNGYNVSAIHKIKPLCNIERVINRPYIDLLDSFGFNNVFSFLFRRKFIEKNRLYFREGINIGEDQIYLSSVLTKTERISCLPVYGYGYDKSVPKSLMRRRWKLQDFQEDHDAFALVLKNLEDQDIRIITKTCLARMRYLYSRLSLASRYLDFTHFSQLIKIWQRTTAAMLSQMEKMRIERKSIDEQASDIIRQVAQNDAESIYLTLLKKPLISNQQHPLESRNDNSIVQLTADILKQKKTDKKYKHFRIFIHAGTHKTGSTSIQQTLWINRNKLQAKGFFFPENMSLWHEPNTHQIPFSIMPETASIKHCFANVSIHTLMQSVFEEAREAGCSNIILSSEFFSPEQADEWPLDLISFRDSLMGAEVKFLFFLRNQVDRALSGYSQMVKATCRNLHTKFEQYALQNDDCFNYTALLKHYRSIFGSKSVYAHFYDTKTNCTDIFYRNFLNVSPETIPNNLTERHNISYSLEDTLMLSYLNQRLFTLFTALPENDIAFLKSSFLDYIRKNCIQTAIPNDIFTSCEQLRQRFKSSNSQLMKMTGIDMDNSCADALGHLQTKIASSGTQNIGNNDALDEWLVKHCLENRYKPTEPRENKLKTKLVTLRTPRTKISSAMNFFHSIINEGRNIEGITEYNYRRKGVTKPGMTAMIRVKNESKNIEPMLESIRGIFDEIIICDNNSTDDSVERIKAYQSSNPDIPIHFYNYPFELSRCGEEHRATNEHSVHSLCYYNNWCLSKCNHQYVCKWDADMIFSRSNIQDFFDIKNKLHKYKKYHLCTLNGQNIYIGRSYKKYRFEGDIHKEVRIFPNTTYVYFSKGDQWEYLKSDKKIRTLHPKNTFFYEIKDTNINEFDHWSTSNPEHMSERKKIEHKNFMHIKSLTHIQDLDHSISEVLELH